MAGPVLCISRAGGSRPTPGLRTAPCLQAGCAGVADSMPAESAFVYAQDFKLDSEWTGRPHERCATDPQAARDDTLPSLRIPTRTGLTATDHIAEALTSNVRAPGADSFESAAQRHRQPGPHPSVPIPTRAGPYPPGPRRPLPVLSPITLGRSASATP